METTLGARHPASTTPARSAADHATLGDLVRLLGGGLTELADIDDPVPLAQRRLEEGQVLAHEGAPLHSLHVVRCGSFKRSRMLEDGYEQVTAFALPGDVLGFDGLHTRRHASTDTALETSAAYALPVAGLRELRQRCPALDRVLLLALSRQLERASATADMLAAVASEVRLARFLLWTAARAAEQGWSPRRLRLRMCRRDIASLLGIAHETASRCFTTLSDAGLLRVHNREVEIVDLPGLQARARTTRRLAEGGGAEHAGGRSPAQRLGGHAWLLSSGTTTVPA